MNQNHPLFEELLKLRESSKEAVADSSIYNQDPLKKYLHITRSVEKNLVEIIKKTESADQKLILVCGNVGDGKSHTLSEVLRNENLKEIIKEFKIHNDATESFSPEKDCLETLYEVLSPFSDSHLGQNDSKIIVATNLGTLSNFIEQYKHEFSEIKSYVDNHEIIESKPQKTEVRNNFFAHINFADYHLFELNSFGANPTVINSFLDKVVLDSKENPIFLAYKKACSNEWAKECILVKNYEFLIERTNRSIIGNLLTRLTIEFKYIISIRQLLNFVFDMIIPPDIANLSFSEYKKKINKKPIDFKLQNYLPFQIFSSPNLSNIHKGLSFLDPCNQRIERLDEELILLHTSNEKQRFYEKLKSVFGLKVSDVETLSEENLSKFYIRYRFFNQNIMFTNNSLYHEYLEALFWNNLDIPKKQKKYHDHIKDAICRWNGNTNAKDKVMVLTDAPQSKYRIFKNHNTSIVNNKKNSEQDESQKLSKFSLELNYYFENGNGSKNISIDFSLYNLLRHINDGYRPNKTDRNNYIQFTMFVNSLTFSDSAQSRLFIDEINIDEAIDFTIKLNDYGDITFEIAK